MKKGGIPIRMQLVIVTMFLVILPVLIVGTVLYFKVSDVMENYIVTSLKEEARLVDGIIEREYRNLAEENNEAGNYCRYLFGERLEVELDEERSLEVRSAATGERVGSIPEIKINNTPAGARLQMLHHTSEHLGVRLALYYLDSGPAVRIYGAGTRRTGAAEISTGLVVESSNPVIESLRVSGRWKGVREDGGESFLTRIVEFKSLQNGASLIMEVQNSVNEHQRRVTDFLSTIEVGKNGYIYVLDSDGNYVLSKDRERDGENIMGATDESGRRFVQEMMEKAPELPDKQSAVLQYRWRSSEDAPLEQKIAVYRYFEPWNWVWGVSAVRADFSGGIAAMRLITIAIGLVFVVLAVIAAFIVGTAFSRPISHIERVMARVADGDLTQEVSLKSSVKELQNLSQNFDGKLLQSMRQMLGRIKDVTNYTHETGEKISNQVEGTLVFTNQMTQQIVGMKRQIHGLDGQINEASSAVEEIQATISNVGKQIDQQSSAVSETSASIEEMNSSIKSVAKIAEEKQEATNSLLEITGKGGEKVRSTNEIIQDIGVSINDMMDMITIINKVAAQTNLLAMNAAIEAAHAGDAGRGFAVVAEEIRNLSTSTSDSAKKISNRLKEIVERIQQATEMSTETGSAFQQIEGEVKEFVNAFQEIASSTAELSTGSEEMLNAVNSLQDVVQEIQDGSEEMQSGSKDINESLQALKDYSGNTVDSLNALVEKTTNVNYAQSNMTDLVIDNNDNAENLAEEISKFRIGHEEESEEGSLSYSDLVKFSVGALLLQEWMVHVRTTLNSDETEKKVPRLEKGRLQKWIDRKGEKLFGEQQEFRNFLDTYNRMVSLTDDMDRHRAAGAQDEAESVYDEMVEQLKQAKSSLHSLRYGMGERLEEQKNAAEDSGAEQAEEVVEDEIAGEKG